MTASVTRTYRTLSNIHLQMSLFEMFLVSGGMLAYWTTYGCSVHLPAGRVQWRTPLSLQIVLAALVVISSFLVPESPRWLMKQGRHEEAARNLSHLRGEAPNSIEVSNEMAEISAQISEEMAATEGRTMTELFEKHNFVRLLWVSVALYTCRFDQTVLNFNLEGSRYGLAGHVGRA